MYICYAGYNLNEVGSTIWSKMQTYMQSSSHAFQFINFTPKVGDESDLADFIMPVLGNALHQVSLAIPSNMIHQKSHQNKVKSAGFQRGLEFVNFYVGIQKNLK